MGILLRFKTNLKQQPFELKAFRKGELVIDWAYSAPPDSYPAVGSLITVCTDKYVVTDVLQQDKSCYFIDVETPENLVLATCETALGRKLCKSEQYFLKEGLNPYFHTCSEGPYWEDSPSCLACRWGEGHNELIEWRHRLTSNFSFFDLMPPHEKGHSVIADL